jgi:lipid-binding SYLF domain-containing protein
MEGSEMRQVLNAGIAVLASSVALTAGVNKAQTNRLREAAEVLTEIHQAPDKDVPNDLWEKTSCVAVIPGVKKVAFVLGGEYGKGVLSCRQGAGWSAPSFMLLEKGSVGFQIGGQSVDLVLLVMNDRGVQHLLADKVALGGEMSVAGGPVGRDARALTDAQLKAEILSYSRTQGLFAGIDLSGGVLKPDNDDNEDLYGRKITAREILVDKTVSPPPAANVFMASLRRGTADVRN